MPLKLAGRSLACEDLWWHLYRTQSRQMAFTGKTKAQWAVWRKRLKAKLLELAGPKPPRVPLKPEIVEETDCGKYVRKLVVYDTMPAASVTAYLLVPKDLKPDERRRAMLCLHGHGPKGKKNVCGVAETDADKTTIAGANYDYARQFAERGYVCLAPDARGWGDRDEGFYRPGFPGRDACNVHFIKAQLWGLNQGGLNLYDDMAAVDYLQSLPFVDPQRIGVMGLSFGGTRTMYVGALDERLKAVDIICYLTTFKQYALAQNNFCGSQFIPGVLNYAEVGDVCALVSPRPLLCESGTQDGGFPLTAAQEGFEIIRRAYKAAGVPDRCEHEISYGGHAFAGKRAFSFFDQWL
ncbi:MAG: hypothetical protein FJ279_20670 [Planctomycetes bacterium]|nr:hypothetical protein [Planctomycetota bacterium]